MLQLFQLSFSTLSNAVSPSGHLSLSHYNMAGRYGLKIESPNFSHQITLFFFTSQKQSLNEKEII